MPLVERLMGLNANGTEAPGGIPDRPPIPVHHFFAAALELALGFLTRNAIETALEMDASEATEFNLLANQAPSGNTAGDRADRALYVERIHAVFTLAEGRYAAYNTPAAVRAKLSLPTP